MVDWVYIGLSSLWILGASVLVAVLGVAVYDSSENKQSLKYLLSKKMSRLFINLGFALICSGLCGLAGLWWEKMFWALLGFGFLANAWFAWKDEK
jgi:hypothetical protein